MAWDLSIFSKRSRPHLIACPDCGTRFHDRPRRTFLGFQKYECPTCHEPVIYPLTSGYRILYGVCAVGMLMTFVATLVRSHHVVLPGLVGAAMLGALWRDAAIQRELRDVPPPPVNPLFDRPRDSNSGRVPPN